jgi:DNA-binding transcriptional MerR regulator
MQRPATTGEAAEDIGVAISTLQRWASQGLVSEAWWRTPGGRLKWDLDKLHELLGINSRKSRAS